MNPLKQFKNYIIGNALLKTDDVFEKARLNMMFNFTAFFIVLGLIFYGNILANNLWWQFYITTFGVIILPFVFVVLKKTESATYAGILFFCNQILMSVANQILAKFESNIVGGLWSMVLVIIVFFVLGKKWGFVATVFVLVSLSIGPINESLGHPFFNYNIPADQIPTQIPIFVLVPFLICVYGIYQEVDTRATAEQQIKEQRLLLERTNKELEVQKHDIVSSINYAQRIQYAVLPHEETIARCIPLSFIYYKPKDIVSGDFFWFHEIDKDNYILVCADCTGHGVPGAFMTVIGSTLLNQTIIDNKIYNPSAILLEVDKLLNVTLKQNKEREYGVQDGMDLSLLKVNKAKKEIIITSAKRPVVFIREKQMQDFKGSKYSLGGMRTGDKTFEEITINYKEDDILYFFTDGYHDQFGGEKGKKFSSKKLKELLFNIHTKPVDTQKDILNSEIIKWTGNLEQVDDMCVVGIRF